MIEKVVIRLSVVVKRWDMIAGLPFFGKSSNTHIDNPLPGNYNVWETVRIGPLFQEQNYETPRSLYSR